MGWRRFNAWLGVMQRQLEPVASENGFEGPEWERMKAERDAMRSG
jgi:hypothetical protein